MSMSENGYTGRGNYQSNGGYTLQHIINDCVQDKLRSSTINNSLGYHNNRSVEYYEECWNALNLWIETKLKKRLGATISPLGDFTWEMKVNNESNEKLCRPIFILNKNFQKDHHIKSKNISPLSLNLIKCEEVNYSNLAIKYTKTLTKDMIFSGIRDIIKKIGDYIDRIYDIEIAFSFGILFCKERRIRFEFDQQKLLTILPESMTLDVTAASIGYTKDTLLQPHQRQQQQQQQQQNQHQVSGHENNDNNNNNNNSLMVTSSLSASLPDLSLSNQKLNTARPSTTTTQQQQQQQRQQLLSSRGNHSYTAPNSLNPLSPTPSQKQQQQQQLQQQLQQIPNLNLTYKTIDRSVPPPPLSPGLQSLLESMNNPTLSHQIKVNNRIQCCDNVAKQAFNRCLYSVENSAIDDDYIEFQRKLLHKTWIDNEKNKKEKFKKEIFDIQDTLRLQMNESNQRKLQDISDRKHGKIHFGLPGQMPKHELSPAEIQEQKEKMLKGLQKQIISTKNENNLIKKQTLQEENIRLKQLQDELEIDRLLNKTKQLEKQRDLLEAWERDAHVKNLQKLVNKGSKAVKSYIKSARLVNESENEEGEREGGGGGGGGNYDEEEEEDGGVDYYRMDQSHIKAMSGVSRGGGGGGVGAKGVGSRGSSSSSSRLNDLSIGYDTRRK